MHPETVQQQIEELEQVGWEVDDTPRAVEKRYRFTDYAETLNFLIDVGSAVERSGAMPSIHIDADNRVTVRVGQPPAAALTDAQIRLAGALPA